MIEVRNLLFQPLTFHLTGGDGNLHLGPRQRTVIDNESISPELEQAARADATQQPNWAKKERDMNAMTVVETKVRPGAYDMHTTIAIIEMADGQQVLISDAFAGQDQLRGARKRQNEFNSRRS